MAMNFKIFEDKLTVSNYVADLFRKQMNNNPTSIIATALGDEAGHVIAELKADTARNPVETSQIHIFDYDKLRGDYGTVGIVDKQYHEATGKDIMELIKDEAKTKENKGKLTTLFATITQDGSVGYKEINQDNDKGLRSAREIIIVLTGADKASIVEKLYNTEAGGNFEAANLKTHRMVNVILDDAAAAGLPQDIREYYFQKFA
ncbi:glucosamine-6-phosphate isomerase [Macrococcoides goetzii]|uniref:Glucosamine-6-phosphate isomerase n=1 Tax=Macrococcoides goetzii TaxID=1891097 RepID=A0A2G5NU30_9STAP|nr:glucosamine-6-phosphate isomerase [Macrococcus goetzii]RAI79632.1 glucosamine-6-phosphate isomerase [Macrococcus goetzii]TDM39562.1 glucosamine-6-phosphate isomerase [Macrococcus goetzii]TDM41461.1 glucosamine-6-phosphate isomerase [Macrococcus goetzii]TDM46839.1 glucosamine-6-phosphate isomerase [Macrococcus goetzii]